MTLTYRCELHTNPNYHPSSRCIVDAEGRGQCGDLNIRHDCIWGSWTKLDEGEYREEIGRKYGERLGFVDLIC